MGWLLRLLLLALALFLILSGLRRLFQPSSPPRPHKKEEGGEGALMVQDPQCGCFVLAKGALTTIWRGKILYFCSPNCRDLYFQHRAAQEKEKGPNA